MNTLTGTGALMRLILRRDRWIMPFWMLFLAILPSVVAGALAELYPSAAGLAAFARGISSNPAEIAFLGPVFAPTLGGLTAWRVGASNGILIAIASFLTVIRHTRTEEEQGRRELLGAGVVGRHAPLVAALLVTLGANAVIAVISVATMRSTGLPLAGAVALALGIAGVGSVWAGMGALAAQLTESAGGAKSIAGVALAVAYVFRALGDISIDTGLGWLRWLSPVGWVHQIRAFAGERWWVLALFGGVTLALSAAALVLSTRRDLGSGIVPPRPGPALAGPGLRNPLALAWRLHRDTLLVWTVGFAARGGVFGFAAQTITEQLNASPQMQLLLRALGRGASVGDGFFTFITVVIAEVAGVFALQATLRLRGEETAQRLDPLLASAVKRSTWAWSHLVFALGGAALVLGAFGAGAGISYGLATDGVGRQLPRLVGSALAYVPAVWVLVGLTTALFGVMPRWTAGGWVVLIGCLLLDLFGQLFGLSERVMDISPFHHVPKTLMGTPSYTAVGVLLIIAAGLLAVGLVGWQRRDVG